MWNYCRFSNILMPFLAALFSMPVYADCPECEDEQCFPLSDRCICTPRLGCAFSIPLGGTKPGSVIPLTPVPLPPLIQEKLDELGEGASRTVTQLGADTLTTIQNGAGDTVQTLKKANGDVLATFQKAGDDAITSTYKAADDAVATYVKSWRDIGEQSKRSFEDAVDAGQAAGHFVENQAKSDIAGLDNAAKRLQDGKVVDAIWHVGTDNLSSSEANFAKATQESTIINSAAASAAATYGGPAGAAAYAAWSTYRQTGNADMALRAGLLAAVTSQSGTTFAEMPTGTPDEIIKKAAMAGAAGGVAVAAAGGDEQAIKDGFLRSSGAVLVQGAGDKLKAYSPNGKEAFQAVQCISARDVDCLSNTTWAKDAQGKILYDESGKPRIDTSKIDPKSYIGKWSQIDPESAEGKVNEIVSKTSKLPKMEAIPILNNKWVLTWSIGKEQNIEYAKPTVVLTYVGEKPPFISKVSYSDDQTASKLTPNQRPNTGNKLVAYYVKAADRQKVVKALEKNSIKYTKVYRAHPQHKDTLSNALICGPNTRASDIKKVARALIKNGIDIKYIGTNSKHKPGQISIVNLKRKKYTVNDPNITLDQIKNLTSCPTSLKNS